MRKAKALKAKAAKCDLGELMQMMMMKAYVVGEEQSASSGGSSSSSEPWTPKDPKEAFDKIQSFMQNNSEQHISDFARQLAADETAT